jgi:DNA-binding GntR family transcriptional regulator
MAQEEVSQKAEKGASWKVIYDALRHDILCLELAPGQLLDETSLAERFDLSRSPVREALIRLANDDLVQILPNRSTIVTPLDLAAVPKYVEALDFLQRVNTRLAAQLRTGADLDHMQAAQAAFKAAVANGHHLAMSETNKAFHMAVALAGKNPLLSSFYERLLDQGRRMLHLHFEFLERTHDGYLLTGEHDDMLDAIREQDVARADALAHAHTRQFQDNFFRFMRENYTANMDLASPSQV